MPDNKTEPPRAALSIEQRQQIALSKVDAAKSKEYLPLKKCRCKGCGQLLGRKQHGIGILEIVCFRNYCKNTNIFF
jgi:hypothetical protein